MIFSKPEVIRECQPGTSSAKTVCPTVKQSATGTRAHFKLGPVYGEEKHRFGNATHCIALSHGEENQRQGGKIKGHETIYTPEQKKNFRHFKSLDIVPNRSTGQNRKIDILSCETDSVLYQQLDVKNTPS